MRILKYTLSSAFILIAFIYISELYVWNIDSFETQYVTATMVKPIDTSIKDMMCEIALKSTEYDCSIFSISREINSMYSSHLIVYGTENVDKYLSKNSYILEGEYHGIISGDIYVEFKDLTDIPEGYNNETFYFIGNYSNIRDLKTDLLNKYGGTFPRKGYFYINSKRNITSIWSIGFLFFLLLSIFDISASKKKITIRIIYGESIRKIILHSLLQDVLFYCLSFFTCYCILKFLLKMHVEYYASISFICLGAFCVINSLIYLKVLHLDIRKTLENTSESSLLILNYFFKCFITSLIVFSMVLSIGVIIKAVSYRAQKSVYEEYGNYSFFTVSDLDKTFHSSETTMIDIFNMKDSENKAFLSTYLGDGESSHIPCLIVNYNAAYYMLKDLREELQNLEKKQLYFIIPHNNPAALDDLKKYASLYLLEDGTITSLEYNKNLIAFGAYRSDKINSELYLNPAIILVSAGLKDYFDGMYIMHASMIQTSDDEWQDLIKDYHMQSEVSYKTNALLHYQKTQARLNREMIIGLTAILMLLLMNIIIVHAMIKNEIFTRSVELAIKTVLGYSYFDKYKKIILFNTVSLIGSMIIGIVFSCVIFDSSIIYILMGYLLIILIDLLIFFINISKLENRYVIKALKGAGL